MSFTKNDIYDLLNAKNIPFTCTEHRPVYSMEELDVLEIPADAIICKNLFCATITVSSTFFSPSLQLRRLT